MAMSTSTNGKQNRIVVSKEVDFERMKNEKLYKDQITATICQTINAFLNTGGGTVRLLHKNLCERKIRDGSVRIIEQKIKDLIGELKMFSNVQCFSNEVSIEYCVTCSDDDGPYAINQYCFFPTKTQVLAVESHHPVKKLKELIVRKKHAKNDTSFGLPCLTHIFVKGEKAPFDEDTNIQWKQLKSEALKGGKIARRIISKTTKLASYISAFANYSGGAVYYGINDDGIVEGEVLTDKDAPEIRRKVAELMKKIIWCGHPEGLREKQHWDVFFIPVRHTNGREIPSVYVIAVVVAFCPGGVFTNHPESYCIIDGKVEKTSDKFWLQYFSAAGWEAGGTSPSKMPGVTWSSEKNRGIYQTLTTKLVQCRNDKKMKNFKEVAKIWTRKYPDSCALPVCLGEKAAVACKNNQFRKARKYFTEIMQLIAEGPLQDKLFFEVRGICLLSRVERAEGNFHRSYQLALDAVQKMQSLGVAEFLTVWFYIHTAAVASILSGEAETSQRRKALERESEMYLQLAVRDSCALDKCNFPRSSADLRQKCHIYLAMTYLGCSLYGKIQNEKEITVEDIDKATRELTAVQALILHGSNPTKFQFIELNLATSDLFYRKAMLATNVECRTSSLRQSFEKSKEAQQRAFELEFEEAVHYASKRLARITERLVRDAFNGRQRQREEETMEDLLQNLIGE